MDFVNNSHKFIHIIANPAEITSPATLPKTEIIEEIAQQSFSNFSDGKILENESEMEVPEETVTKLKRICRCCLSENDNLRDIYEEGENIVEMLMNLAQIQICLEDILPPLVCLNCCVQIERIYEFKNQIEMAEATLRHLVNVNSYQVLRLAPVEDSDAQSCDRADDTLPEAIETQLSDESINSVDGAIPEETVPQIHSQEVEVIRISSKMEHNQEIQKAEGSCDEENDANIRTEETEEMSIDSIKDLLCFICNKGFIDKKEFQNHFKDHEQNNLPHNCIECNESFRFESDLEIHNSLHAKNGKKQCLFCKKEVTTVIQLKRHIKTHFKHKPHICQICEKGFPEMGSLTRHLRSHSGLQRVKKHLCTVCGKGYYDAYSLSVHTRNHTGERPFICSICGKTFIDCRLLNSHMKVHSQVKSHMCTICQRRFTHQSTLTTHLRTHTGLKPYVCSVCGKSFIQSSNLSLHMRTHNGSKPYKCETCGRAFASSSTLITHNRIHTGLKPYQCGICGKAFARQDLKAHIRTHTGEKPFGCTGLNCHKKFTTRGQLNQHMRIHRVEKSLVCKICQKRCYSSGNLKSHMKTHENSGSIEEKVPPTPNEVIIYAKSDINPLIVQEIATQGNTQEERKSRIVNLQIQEEVSRSQLPVESLDTTTKYIVSNVIQVPFIINAELSVANEIIE